MGVATRIGQAVGSIGQVAFHAYQNGRQVPHDGWVAQLSL
jgi:hypothetical protein